MTVTAPQVRPVRPAEIAAVAALHLRAFPDYESTKLGAGYCRRMLRAYAARSDAWVDVALDERGGLTGYLVAAPPATQRTLNRALLPWAGLHSLRRPAVLAKGLGGAARRLRRTIRPGRPDEAAHAVTDGPAAAASAADAVPAATIRVVLVAVDPAARGTGVADALLGAFARTARERGHAAADLSVAPGNQAAHGAYLRNGWTPVGGDDGAVSHFRLDLSGPAAP